jgi:hypothetical protein
MEVPMWTDEQTAAATDLDIPVLQGPQRQGDILILPLTDNTLRSRRAPTPIPADGIPVVHSESTNHAHTLIGQAAWTVAVWSADLGVLDVTGTAYLVHPEHAALGIGPGRYLLRRQREHTQAGSTPIAD